MTSNRKRVLLFIIKSIFLIFRADDFTKSFLANLPFCRHPLLFLFYPFGFQCFVVLLSFAELSHFTTAATAHPSPIHRLGIKLPNSPVPLLHPIPTTDYYLSLSSFCLVPSVISSLSLQFIPSPIRTSARHRS